MNKATKVTTALLGLTIAVKVESQSSLSVQNMPEVNMYEYEMLKSLAGQWALVAEESEYCVDERISETLEYQTGWCELWRGGAMAYYGNVLKSLSETTLCTHDIFDNACGYFDLVAPTFSEDIVERHH